MRIRSALGIVGLCLLGSGCSLVVNGTQNLMGEASLTADECRERHHFRRLAEDAWQEARHTSPAADAEDYACGFKDGFADFLEAGGSGQPPPVPPRHYWTSRYETPAGYHRIEAWYAGFREGASAARASGYRQVVTLPSPLSGKGPLPPPLPEIGPVPVPAPGPVAELLPSPLPMAPGDRTAPPPETPKTAPPAAPKAAVPPPVLFIPNRPDRLPEQAPVPPANLVPPEEPEILPPLKGQGPTPAPRAAPGPPADVGQVNDPADPRPAPTLPLTLVLLPNGLPPTPAPLPDDLLPILAPLPDDATPTLPLAW